MKPISSTEERVWAVLAHLSALVMGMGLILPIIGWAEQRRKSKFIAYQCLQALGYQTLGYTIWLLGYLLFITVIIVLMMIVAMVSPKDGDAFAASLVGFNIFFFVFVIGSLGVYLLLPIIAAVACGMGKDFRYPIMGKRLAKYLEYNAESENGLNEDHEDRWVAAAGHFSVILAFWGLLAPITAWILQGKRSAWLKFQSAQAIALHASVLILGIIAGMFYMVGMVAFIALTGFDPESVANSSAGLMGLVVMFGSMIVALLIALLVPLFHIAGQWAGYRVLKGDDYWYPIIGKLIARVIPPKEHWDDVSGAKNLPAREEDPSLRSG
ncbi:MAG: DUF4870 domain-containing protein [Anaerolineae bacterium]|jgi:uncharacterized Tic20 family protein|nr:DUF4870 domain-containing protein [Anaerolineae bacterium]MBL8107204.1 DUF4870 domain-containing protein [Anaerolineales bacterium]MCC7190247.1 DUF4870 domain-containing protein [Anaerolineales bacterium]